MRNNDWKYLLRELVLHYSPIQIMKFVGTNRTSVYKWLSGETYPRFDRFKEKLIKLATTIDSVSTLMNKSKKKEKTLFQLSKKRRFNIINETIIIQTIPVIWPEIKRRKRISANKWYIKEIGKEYVTVKYFNNKKDWKNVNLPLQLAFNREFARIVGMWFGDGITKGPKKPPYRAYISFSNEEIHVLEYLKDFFFNLKQSNCIDIEIINGKFVNKERLRNFLNKIKKLSIKTENREQGKWNSLGASFHVRNAPLSYVFEVIKENISHILQNSSNEIKSAFLGGYFTAEGNVSKINQWFTISETKSERRKLILMLLQKLEFKDIYEGREEVIIGYKENKKLYNFELFEKLILPHIFSKVKSSKTIEMLESDNLREIDLVYLFYLYLHPDSTSEFFASKFSKSRNHINKIFRRLEGSKTKLVERKRSNNRTEFYKLNLTKDGKQLVMKRKENIKKILTEVKRVDNFNRGYKGTFYLSNPAIREIINYLNL